MFTETFEPIEWSYIMRKSKINVFLYSITWRTKAISCRWSGVE